VEFTNDYLEEKAKSLRRAPIEQQHHFQCLVFSLQGIGHITYRQARKIITILTDLQYDKDNE